MCGLFLYQDVDPRSEQAWWKSYIPSKPLMFLVLWPFIVNIVFYYFRRRKVRQIDKHIYKQTAGKKKQCLKQSLNSIRTKEMTTWSQ